MRSAVLLAAVLLGACKKPADAKQDAASREAASRLVANAAGCPALELEHDVALDGFRATRYAWRDGVCRSRSAFMVRNDVKDPTGQFGGYLRRYTSEVDGRARGCDGSTEHHPGFGFTINHYLDASNNDTSNSSKEFAGTYRTVLAGRHHALHEYQWTLNLGGHPVKTTIHWLFATGKDHPLWAITFDTSQIAPNKLNADTRAPYGDLLYDGNANAEIAGVMWGDRYRFESLHSPLTVNSGWDYSVPNLVPFTLTWTSNPDAEMGSVQTQTWQQHDAGQGWLYAQWGKRSNSGPMPADWNWTYQLNQYELPWTTRSHRLAWGTHYGAVGYSQYPAYGDDRQLSGYPYQSYSVFIVLGRHSARTVLSQVEQVEAFQDVKLTASVGQVLTQGPAGVGRPDSASYQPAGYNPVYATWEVQAASNRAQLTFTSGAREVDSPVFVLRGYTAAVPPTRVLLDGVELKPDMEYFASVDDAGDALWLTLARSVGGTVNLTIE